MANKFNTAFQIHQEIYDTRKLIQNKKTECNEIKEYIDYFNNNRNDTYKNINETNMSIKALNNFIDYNTVNSCYFTTLSIKKHYTDSLEILNKEMTYIQNNIDYYENELKKIDIEFMAYDTYIDNLYKLIPRINRWSHIENMTSSEIDIEIYNNNKRFETQLYILNHHS